LLCTADANPTDDAEIKKYEKRIIEVEAIEHSFSLLLIVLPSVSRVLFFILKI
jgi:hypothetical protein